MAHIYCLLAFLATSIVYGEESMDTESKLNRMEKRMAELEARLSEIDSKRSNHIGKRGITNVAFSTIYTSNSDHHKIGEVVKYTKVLTNDGTGYDARTGVFTAPITGTYLFMYHFAHLWSVGQVWLQLTHNGNLVNMAPSDVLKENQDVQGSNSAILHVRAGDRIWMEFTHTSDTGLHGSREFTTFSGVLLY